jgi:hypothetical protein
MSSDNEAVHSLEHQAHPEPRQGQIPADAAQVLVPLENHREVVLFAEHEHIVSFCISCIMLKNHYHVMLLL